MTETDPDIIFYVNFWLDQKHLFVFSILSLLKEWFQVVFSESHMLSILTKNSQNFECNNFLPEVI